jgi:hypothetical protein
MLQLSIQECRAIYELIDMLSGGNAENVFSDNLWDGESLPLTNEDIAFGKLYCYLGKEVPKRVKHAVVDSYNTPDR